MNTKFSLLTTIMGLIIGSALYTFVAHQATTFNANDIGLGMNTISKTETFEGNVVSAMLASELRPHFNHLAKSNPQAPTILMTGASQLHGLNQPHDEDHLAVYVANKSARNNNRNYQFFQLSSPLASVHELLGLFFTLTQLKAIPNYLVVAINFDNFREHYPETKQSFQEMPKITNAFLHDQWPGFQYLSKIQQDAIQKQDGNHSHFIGTNGDGGMQKVFDQLVAQRNDLTQNTLNNTPQEILEKMTIKKLEHSFPSLKNRIKAAGLFEYEWQRFISQNLRGKIQRKAASLSTAQIELSLDSLKTLALYAQSLGTKVIFYRQPLRPIAGSFFYDRTQFDAFFESLLSWCHLNKVTYKDFMDLVPEQYWGQANGGLPDFFHFQAQGHQLLGNAIFDLVDSLIHPKPLTSGDKNAIQ